MAPSIAGLPEWYVLAQLQHFNKGERGMHPEDTGGLRMYPMSLTLKSTEDMQAVAAFVAALPKVTPERTLSGGDAARGAQLYTVCLACHGPDGGGNQAVGSPPISESGRLVPALVAAEAQGRPPRLLPECGGDARHGRTLTDEQAMKDVIAHIMTLHPTNAAAAAPKQ